MSQHRLLVIIVLASASCGVVSAQGPPVIPSGWVLVDDMILPDPALDSNYTSTPWPGGVVPFAFASNVTAGDQTAMLAAMAELEAIAKVDFVVRTTQSNYLLITLSSTQCASYLGMLGGGQPLYIISWCVASKYSLVHELSHALGFNHEQCRPDRDNYIQINWANISQTACAGTCNYNFILDPSATPVGPYDFLSIMHYYAMAFSANGQPTITVLPPNQAYQSQIGQITYMTALDAGGIAARYGAPLPPSISGLDTVSVALGSGNVTIAVTGTRFLGGSPNGQGVQGTRVVVDGVEYSTTFVSPTVVQATLPSALFQTPDCLEVRVKNPLPGGGISAPASLQVATAATAVLSSSTNSFDSQGPVCAYRFPTPLGASGDQERVSWNGAGGTTHPATVGGPSNLGMPASGSQYLRVPSHSNGGIQIPIGGPLPRPLSGALLAANEVRIPIPTGSRWVAFAWDFYCSEYTPIYNDGMSIDVVDGSGHVIKRLVYADIGSPVSPTAQIEAYGQCNPLTYARDFLLAGPQYHCEDLPTCPGLFLSIVSWNGLDDLAPSIAALDDVRFGGRDADFELQNPLCGNAFPSPISGFASPDPELVSWNGAGVASGHLAKTDATPNSMGMPSSQNRYLRISANGGYGGSSINVPVGTLVPRPLTGALLSANEVSIPIPLGAGGVSVDWDFYDAEQGSTFYVDGLSIDVVGPTGNRIVNVARADSTSPVAVGTPSETGGGCSADSIYRIGKLDAGFQRAAVRLPPLPFGSRLSIVCWNGLDDEWPSHAVIDRVHFAETSGFSIALGRHAGPGSLQLAISNGTPGAAYRSVFTVAPGAFPNGWFFGIDPSIGDVLAQLGFPVAPFAGVLGPEGDAAFELPSGVPGGLPLHIVSLEFTPGGAFLAVSPPVTYTTL